MLSLNIKVGEAMFHEREDVIKNLMLLEVK